VLVPLKRKARAIMAIRQWLKFPRKMVSRRDATWADVVTIHQHVLKSTTSTRERDAKNWMVALVYLVCLVCLVFLAGRD